MSGSATLSVTIPDEMAGRLADIAKRDDSTADRVIAKALEDYFDRDIDIKAAIERGRADLRAGRLFTQAEVVREITGIIAHLGPDRVP